LDAAALRYLAGWCKREENGGAQISEAILGDKSRLHSKPPSSPMKIDPQGCEGDRDEHNQHQNEAEREQ